MPALSNDKWPKYKGWPIILVPPSLYEAAKREGFDMGYYQKLEPIPLKGLQNARTPKR
jgi:hypothetical protein